MDGGSERRQRVTVVEDHPLYRFAVVHALERDDSVVLAGVAGDAEEALEVIREQQPDLVLLDLHLPGRDGLSVLRELTREPHSPRVVVLSGDADVATVAAALAAGAAGYLLKEIDQAGLSSALAAAARGELVLPRHLQGELLRRTATPAAVPLLTERECDVLSRTALGRSRREIADELFISEATVKARLATAYEKLGVRDRAAAVAQAIWLGVLETPVTTKRV